MTLLSWYAYAFGALFCTTSVWTLYLLFIKGERVDEPNLPVSGWGMPDLEPVRQKRVDKPTNWEFHQLFAMVKLVDGTECSNPLVMRRWDGNRWLYRVPTQDELYDYKSREAW